SRSTGRRGRGGGGRDNSASWSTAGSPLGLRSVNQVPYQLLQGDLAAVRFLRGPVLAHLAEPLPVPQRLAFALVQDLHIDGNRDLALRDVGASLPRLERERHVRIVAGDFVPHHGVGVVFARRVEPEPALERLEHGMVYFLGERGLGGLIVERQDGD